MRTFFVLSIVAVAVLAAGTGFGAHYTGTYVLKSGGVTVTLVLKAEAGGKVSGTMSSTKGSRFAIDGSLEEDIVVGICSGEGGNAYFEAELGGKTLRLTMFEMGANNMPDYTKATSLEFAKQSDEAAADPFVGTFRGQELELSLQGSGGNYTGTLGYGGRSYPVRARSKGGDSIEGTFESDGKAFPFTATIAGDSIKFVTENVPYTLKKEAVDRSTARERGDMPASTGTSPERGESGGGGSDVVTDPQMGLSFKLPSGWIAKKQESGFILGSETHKGVIVMMPHEYTDLTTMVNEAGRGIVDEGSGTYLMPASKIAPFGKNGIACEFKGTYQGQAARSYAVGLLSPNGGGVIILAAVESKSYTNAYPQFVQALASSVTFSKGQPAQGKGGGRQQGGDLSLMTYFAGTYYSYTGGSTMSGGAGTERRIMLCANGNFYDSSEFSASGSGSVDWGGARSGSGSGRWRITGSKTQGVITIIRPNGNSEEVEYLVTGKGVIRINGITFAYEKAAECD